MRVHEFEFMIKVKWRIDLYTLQNEIKKVNLSFPISVERCEAKKFRLCAFCVFGFIVKMRGNWVEEFNYTMKKLQLIRQIIEFSMKFFLLCFFVQSCCLCCVERVSSDDNRAHDSSISYHHRGVSGHSTCNPFVPGWGSGGGLVWPTAMSFSMKTCFLWWIYIYFFDLTFIIPESFRSFDSVV